MTFPLPRITVTVTKAIPAAVGANLGTPISGVQLNVNAVLQLPQEDALFLIRNGYAQQGSDTAMPGSATAPKTTVTVVKTIPSTVGDLIGLTAGQLVIGQELALKHDDAMFLVKQDYAQIRKAADAPGNQSTGTRGVRSAVLDFPSIAANGNASLTINVPGAAVGDPVVVGAPAALAAGLVPVGFVSAAGVATIRVQNVTAAPIDPASATWKVAVLKGAN